MTGGVTTPVLTVHVLTVPVFTIGVGLSLTVRITAGFLLNVLPRTFLRLTCMGYVPAFAGAGAVRVYFPGVDASFAGMLAPSIRTFTSESHGSASIVNVTPVPVSTSSPGATEVL